MDAIILAAGRGSRMGSLTAELPKCMTRLASRPLLDWQLAALREGGARRVAVVAGYKAETFDSYCGQPSPIVRFLNSRWADTNMVMSLATAGDWLKNRNCLVSYSDIFYSPQTVAALAAAPGDIAITYDPNWRELWSARFDNPLADAETFRRDANGRLLEIGDRANSLEEIEGQYMGLLKFTPAGWDLVISRLQGLPDTQRDKLSMTGLLQLLLVEGVAIHATACVGAWGEVDNEQDLRVYEAMLRDGRLRLDWSQNLFASQAKAG